MKKYELINQITGTIYGIYDDREAAKHAYDTWLEFVGGDENYLIAIVELPEVEDPEVDYELIDCLINEMIEDMQQIFRLVNLDHISLTYTTNPETNNTGAFMSAWSGGKYGITYIGNRANIFKRIYNQIKEGNKNEVTP